MKNICLNGIIDSKRQDYRANAPWDSFLNAGCYGDYRANAPWESFLNAGCYGDSRANAPGNSICFAGFYEDVRANAPGIHSQIPIAMEITGLTPLEIQFVLLVSTKMSGLRPWDSFSNTNCYGDVRANAPWESFLNAGCYGDSRATPLVI